MTSWHAPVRGLKTPHVCDGAIHNTRDGRTKKGSHMINSPKAPIAVDPKLVERLIKEAKPLFSTAQLEPLNDPPRNFDVMRAAQGHEPVGNSLAVAVSEAFVLSGKAGPSWSEKRQAFQSWTLVKPPLGFNPAKPFWMAIQAVVASAYERRAENVPGWTRCAELQSAEA